MVTVYYSKRKHTKVSQRQTHGTEYRMRESSKQGAFGCLLPTVMVSINFTRNDVESTHRVSPTVWTVFHVPM